MIRLWLVIGTLLASVCFSAAEPTPLTPKEVGLMLRSGYSSDAVIKEVSKRHFVGPLDSDSEVQLIHAGATQGLLDTLRDSAYQASTSQLAALEDKRAKQEDNAAEAAARAERTENAKAEPARPNNPAPSGPPDAIYRLLKGDLISFHQGAFAHFDDEALEHKKLYLFFFSGNWSPVGRKFTSELAEYYNRIAPDHPEFEVVFFSADRSQFGMETYMSQSNMPWPAVAYDKVVSKAGAMQGIGDVPCLIVTDAAGRVLVKSGSAQSVTDLEKVLTALDGIFAHGTAAVAQRH